MRSILALIFLLAALPAMAGERALVATATLVPRTHTVALPDKVGVLRAVDERRLGFPVGGRLQDVVEEGTAAAAGEILAHLDEGLARAEVEQAEIRLREASSELHRASQLHEAAAQSGRALEHAQNTVDLRRAELAIARERLGQRRIVAPFDGVAVDVHAEPGEVLSPAAPVVTFVNLDVMRVKLGVPGNQVVQLEAGAPALLSLIGPDAAPFEGVVHRVAAAAVDGNHHFEVEVRVPNPRGRAKGGEMGRPMGRLRSGTTVRVRLVVAVHPDALLVPIESVVERGGERIAFFVDGGSAVAVSVDGGVRDGDVFVLPASIEWRDLVVRGQRDLHDGSPVTVDNSVLVGASVP